MTPTRSVDHCERLDTDSRYDFPLCLGVPEYRSPLVAAVGTVVKGWERQEMT